MAKLFPIFAAFALLTGCFDSRSSPTAPTSVPSAPKQVALRHFDPRSSPTAPTSVPSVPNQFTLRGLDSKSSSTAPTLQKSVSQTDADKARAPLDGDVRIELVVTELPGRFVRLLGATNLPRDTKLILSVQERDQDGFIGQSECAIMADGSFQSEAIGPTGGLKTGIYIATVTMPIPRMQPEHVQKIIDANGEKLSGPLVRTSNFGPSASMKKEFEIGKKRPE